jgi:signal transduction histidine kinase
MRRRLARAAAAVGALVATVALTYALVVLALGHAPSGSQRTALALSVVATVAVAILYPRVRGRAVHGVDRLLRTQRPPPDEPLRLFTGRLSRAIPLEELLLQTTETLRRAFELRAAEIWTGSAGELGRVVSDPDRGPARLSLATEQPVVAREGVAGEGFASVWLRPLLAGREPALLRIAPAVRAGELLGLIVAERPPDGDPFSEREDEVLGELARQVALALHNARLDSALQASLEALQRQADELRASRARVVASADAERRRIERDLHDGAQQRLISLMVGLGEARELLTSDSRAASVALNELKQELEGALDELRDLARGIYPPLLWDSGLPDALSAAAARAPIACRVETDGVGRYPSELEAAVYFCCVEAIQNASKHAGEAARASISICEEADRLVFAVRDDGKGFEPGQARPGIGLTSMDDRLGAIGGRLEIESAPGRGTQVRGSVPLAQGASSDR